MLIRKNPNLAILGLFGVFVIFFGIFAYRQNNVEEMCRSKAKEDSLKQVLLDNPTEQNKDVIGSKAFKIEVELLMKCLKNNKVD